MATKYTKDKMIDMLLETHEQNVRVLSEFQGTLNNLNEAMKSINDNNTLHQKSIANTINVNTMAVDRITDAVNDMASINRDFASKLLKTLIALLVFVVGSLVFLVAGSGYFQEISKLLPFI